ncbi:hypothetical protein F4827_004935 [Paraburkholderia bannensis]|uniref:DUF2917 domain-containing protein n=1 Tax=Paraburkholderia bannensis TaxID=765414 RepID=A0A7W9U3A2_9BURK|nr:MULTISPECIES: DUF2917 domain-containing protein [Paraburkholderia]MBB3260258.1 hypothetical protein [Paraburkholderia sp. WP4_3_2]MBB6105070.1 hypothetical protein [Paraburkholderia bannensis]
MDQASQQDAAGACSALRLERFDRFPLDAALPAQSIHFAVPAGQTLTWRVAADSTVRVHGSRIWLTRARSPYDHWLNPGETLRVLRGERLWLSSDACADALSDNELTTARVTITCAWRPPLASARWIIERYVTRFFCLPRLTLRRAR